MKALFDTTAWVDIIHDRLRAADLQCLLRAVETGGCTIFLSPHVLEELLPEKQHDPARFKRCAPLICKWVGGDLLLPYNLRMVFEVFQKRALDIHECLTPDLGTGGLLQYIVELDPADLLKKIAADKSSMMRSMAETHAKCRDYIAQNTTRSGHEAYTKEKRRRLGEETAEYFFSFWSQTLQHMSCRSLPTNWSFFAFEIARQALVLAPEVGRRRRESLDGSTYDQIVFTDSFALGCDYLVSSDADLAEIVRVIAEVDDRTPKVIALEDFLRQLASVPAAQSAI